MTAGFQPVPIIRRTGDAKKKAAGALKRHLPAPVGKLPAVRELARPVRTGNDRKIHGIEPGPRVQLLVLVLEPFGRWRDAKKKAAGALKRHLPLFSH